MCDVPFISVEIEITFLHARVFLIKQGEKCFTIVYMSLGNRTESRFSIQILTLFLKNNQ